MAKKKLSARAERRALDRDTGKLLRAKEKIFGLEAGGSPERPIELGAASEVEVAARSMRCPRCEGALELLEHLAETVEGRRLRIARVRCKVCGSERRVYFRLEAARLN